MMLMSFFLVFVEIGPHHALHAFYRVCLRNKQVSIKSYEYFISTTISQTIQINNNMYIHVYVYSNKFVS
jgi:hypothetical protein